MVPGGCGVWWLSAVSPPRFPLVPCTSFVSMLSPPHYRYWHVMWWHGHGVDSCPLLILSKLEPRSKKKHDSLYNK
jgi:hypothetical protein